MNQVKVSIAQQGINLHDTTRQTDGKQVGPRMERVTKERLMEGGKSENEVRVKANVKGDEGWLDQ